MSTNNTKQQQQQQQQPEKEEDDEPILPLEEQTQRPPDLALHQQRIPAWNPILDPVWVIIALFYLGIIMVPTGTLCYVMLLDTIQPTLVYPTVPVLHKNVTPVDVRTDQCLSDSSLE